MGVKIPKDVEYLDTTTKAPSGKKLLKDKSLPDTVVKKYKDNELNEEDYYKNDNYNENYGDV